MHGQQRADVRQHAITTARTALGDWWRSHLGQSWWELLADPGTRADALWQAASAVVVAVEPIIATPALDDPRYAQLQRERDFFAGQADALRNQLERLLKEWGAAAGLIPASSAGVPGGPGRPVHPVTPAAGSPAGRPAPRPAPSGPAAGQLTDGPAGGPPSGEHPVARTDSGPQPALVKR